MDILEALGVLIVEGLKDIGRAVILAPIKVAVAIEDAVEQKKESKSNTTNK